MLSTWQQTLHEAILSPVVYACSLPAPAYRQRHHLYLRPRTTGVTIYPGLPQTSASALTFSLFMNSHLRNNFSHSKAPSLFVAAADPLPGLPMVMDAL